MNARIKRVPRWLVMGVLGSLAIGPAAWAHQPVMDMAPRWKDGYGGQVRHTWRGSDTLKNGDSEVANPAGRKKRVNTTWLEGVYTFSRAARVTFKLPWIDQSRVSVSSSGARLRQTDSGWGDLILGVPLKRYSNRDGVTTNLGITPSIRVPTGSTTADFPVGDGSTDFGLSTSYSRETTMTYQLYELFYWANTRGSKGIAEGDQVGLDVNVGLHPYHSNATNSGVFVMWDVSTRYKDRGVDTGGTTGGTRISTGPILVLYRKNVMFRAEYRVPVYENVNGTQTSFGPDISVGLGITF